jgi:hypothetical protein
MPGNGYHKKAKGWPKGMEREHRQGREWELRTPDERKFFLRWSADIRTEFKRACQRSRFYAYLGEFNGLAMELPERQKELQGDGLLAGTGDGLLA